MAYLLPLVLETLHKNIQERLQNTRTLSWKDVEPTQDDLQHLQREAEEVSNFDPLKLRLKMFQDLQSKKAVLITKESEYAKVLAIVYPRAKAGIPWDLFGRIFQSFGPAESKIPWRLVWFANPTERKFPKKGTEPGPRNVNGGYTFPCRPETIIVYREEEVARVLVHELLHAACTDDMNDSEHVRESKTESWAELFLIAIQATSLEEAKNLWTLQANWITAQEYLLVKEHGVTDPRSYAWRYTIGRRAVLEGLGCVLPGVPRNPRGFVSNSLRFTHPRLDS
jgi:hypothetical protein